ncbi:hypothetical protein ACOMHN_026151 [Nucella lapillus]
MSTIGGDILYQGVTFWIICTEYPPRRQTFCTRGVTFCTRDDILYQG